MTTRDLRDRTTDFGAEPDENGLIRCDACPVLCRIKPGRTGACDRYANDNGQLVRCAPVTLSINNTTAGQLAKSATPDPADSRHPDTTETAIATAPSTDDLTPETVFVTGIGSGTTYPDYKPAPFIVSASHHGVDTVTVVTEGIFSYCGARVKIDTDRHLGAECATVFADGQAVGHVTTAEYGSQMLSLGGVHHLTGGSKKEGRVTCETLLALCNREAVDLTIDNGARITVQAGQAPIVNGVPESRMRVGCGSATVGIFAQQWHGLVDEVIVVDDHITGVLSEHQAGKCLNMPEAGVKVAGAKSTPGRYFKVANPGQGWGGTDISEPLSIIRTVDSSKAWAGLRLLMTSTTGEDVAYYVLDEQLQPVEQSVPPELQLTIDRIGENCEPSLATVIFTAGAGGSLRAGVTENPVRLTQAVARGDVTITMGGAPVYVMPGGGITVMADVLAMPLQSFGYVPTPALVAPLEFTLSQSLYLDNGGHRDHIVSVDEVIRQLGPHSRLESWLPSNPWPFDTGVSRGTIRSS